MAPRIQVTAKRVERPVCAMRLKPGGSRIVTDGVGRRLNLLDEVAIEEAPRLREAHGGDVAGVSMGGERAQAELRAGLAVEMGRIAGRDAERAR